jgi:hypothetical protein
VSTAGRKRFMASRADSGDAGVVLWDMAVPSLNKRLLSLDRLLRLAAEFNEESAKPGPLRKICRAVLVALFERHFTESKWHNALYGALFNLCGLTKAPFSIIDYVVETITDLKGKGLSGGSMAVMEISSLLLHKYVPSDGAVELLPWQSLLILLMGTVIEDAAVQTSPQANIVSELLSKLFSMWRCKSRLFTLCCDHWITKTNTVIVGLAAVVQFVGSVDVKKQMKLSETALQELLNRVHTTVIDRFVKLVFASKLMIRLDHFMHHLGSYFAALPAFFWDPSMAPADASEAVAAVGSEVGLMAQLVKAMKKSSEGSSAAIAIIVSQVTLNMSTFVNAGAVTNAVKLLKSTDPEVRAGGLVIFKALAEKTRDSGAFSIVVQNLLDALSGKSGSMTIVQRCAVCVALFNAGGQATPVGGAQFGAQLFSETVLPTLLSSLEKETDENMRFMIAHCVGIWSTCTGVIPPVFVTGLKAALAKSPVNKAVVESYMFALFSSIREDSTDLVALLEPMVPQFINIVKEAAKKPASANSDAVVALRLLCQLSVVSSTALSAMNTNKFWSLLAAGGSFLLSRRLLYNSLRTGFEVSRQSDKDECMMKLGMQSFSGAVAQSLSYIYQCFYLHQPSNYLASTQGNSAEEASVGSVAMAYVCLLDHPNIEVRNITRSNIVKCFNGSPSHKHAFSVSLLSALNSSLQSWTTAKIQLENELLKSFKSSAVISAAAVEDSAVDSKRVNVLKQLLIPSPSSLSTMFLACIPVSTVAAVSPVAPALPELQALSFYVSTHPLVCNNSLAKAAMLWTTSLKMLSDDDGMVGLTHDAVQMLGARITTAIQAADITDNSHILTMIRVIASSYDSVIHDVLLPFIVETLSGAELNSVSAKDVQIYLFPQQAIQSFITANEVSSSDIKLTNADRKKDTTRGQRRGNFESDMFADEEWAERIRKEKAQQLNQSKAGGFTDLREKAAAEVNSICQRVDAVVFRARRVLLLVAALCSSKSDAGTIAALRNLIPKLLPHLMGLLNTLLLGDIALEAVMGMCQLIEPNLKHLTR